jgi:hypothetical protein
LVFWFVGIDFAVLVGKVEAIDGMVAEGQEKFLEGMLKGVSQVLGQQGRIKFPRAGNVMQRDADDVHPRASAYFVCVAAICDEGTLAQLKLTTCLASVMAASAKVGDIADLLGPHDSARRTWVVAQFAQSQRWP